MKNIFYYIYTIYAWLVGGLVFFTIAALSILILYVVPVKKFRPIFILLLKFNLLIMFIRVKVEMPKNFNFESDKRYIYMPNHVSILDAPIMAAYIPQLVNAVEAKEHFSWAIYGKLIEKWGNIPIERKSVQKSITSMNKAKLKLQNDNSILVFPEGGRTRNGQLLRFKKLPFQLAKDAGVAIIPVGMSGVYSLNKKGSVLMRPGRVKIKFASPIPAEKVIALPHDELMKETRAQIESLIEYI